MLLKNTPERLATLWLEFYTFDHQDAVLLSRALTIHSQLEWLEVHEPKGDNLQYDAIFQNAWKLKNLEVTLKRSLVPGEQMILADVMRQKRCRLQQLELRKSSLKHRSIGASVERNTNLIRLGYLSRKSFLASWGDHLG